MMGEAWGEGLLKFNGRYKVNDCCFNLMSRALSFNIERTFCSSNFRKLFSQPKKDQKILKLSDKECHKLQ